MMILVERIEDGLAVLEITDPQGKNERRTVSVSELGISVRAGDVLIETTRGYAVDAVMTQQRRQMAIRRLRHLKTI